MEPLKPQRGPRKGAHHESAHHESAHHESGRRANVQHIPWSQWVAITVLFWIPVGTLVRVPAGASIPPPVVDVQSSIGVSSEGTELLAAQARASGPLSPSWRYLGEAGLGFRPGASESYSLLSTEKGSDSFGAAYPYTGRPVLLEDYLERSLTAGHYTGAVRLGRFRPPFGIFSESDYAYTGFTRAPLIRYESNWALSNFWFDTGVDMVMGEPHLQLELSSGTPGDDVDERRKQFDAVARLQGYVGPLIAGVSHIITNPPADYFFAGGRSEFSGVDFRVMRSGVQVRGEWIAGHQLSGTYTQGWHIDTLVHEPALERVTWVGRYEELRYSAGVNSANLSRLTLGGRVTLTEELSAELNVIQHSSVVASNDRAVDIALTYHLRS